MKILAWDTSTRVLSVALFDGATKVASSDLSPMPSDSLIPVVERLLRKHRWTIHHIGCLAVGLGPGSFTGLRVGVMSAQIIGAVAKVPLVGISSLEAVAFGVRRFQKPIAVVQDARKNQIYAGLYQFTNEKTKIILKPILTTREYLLTRVEEGTLFVGDASSQFQQEIQFDERYFYPKAEFIARLAAGRIAARKFIQPENLKPLYLHPKDCNVKK